MPVTPDTAIQYIPRVGPAMSARLSNLGISTVRDLLYHIPFRYEDYSRSMPIAALRPGDTVSLYVDVVSIKTFATKTGRRFQQATVTDGTKNLSVIWFNQPYLISAIPVGSKIALAGKIDFFGAKLAMISPSYEVIKNDGESFNTGRLVAIYPETEGITSKWLRGRIGFLLTQPESIPEDLLPPAIVKKYGLMALSDAIRQVHFPDSLESAEKGKRRLGFDELFLMLMTAKNRKREWEKRHRAPVITSTEAKLAEFLSVLPFSLTPDQKTGINEVADDLKRTVPMNRLLLGDVGSGKTVVAAAAAYLTALDGFSTALMAPTQVLAEQHFKTVSALLTPLGIRVECIIGGTKRTPAPAAAKTSGPAVFVGTHALLEENLTFGRLGLVVVDEQQRFGVKQRAVLQQKGMDGQTPHLLTMTATPIPRTVALTVYGHLDISVLATMPTGRKRIKTWLVPREKRNAAYGWIRDEINTNGTQAFIVCPFIEDSESMATVKSALSEYERLTKEIFPDLKLLLLHGRMKPEEKRSVLEKMKRREADILVATPVVEVGIDIPTATVIVIEAAERFGLAQLHQMRGRVGRSERQSYCLLFTEAENDTIRTRLKYMETADSGPVLAQKDFELRGPGDMMGTRQHGIPPFVIASLGDTSLLTEAKSAVDSIWHENPDLSAFPHLSEEIKQRTIRIVSLD